MSHNSIIDYSISSTNTSISILYILNYDLLSVSFYSKSHFY